MMVLELVGTVLVACSQATSKSMHGEDVKGSTVYKTGYGGYARKRSGGGGGGGGGGAGTGRNMQYVREERINTCAALEWAEGNGNYLEQTGGRSGDIVGELPTCEMQHDKVFGPLMKGDPNPMSMHLSMVYRGCQIRTRNGYLCHPWMTTVHNGWDFPDKGLCNNNYCRNPDNKPGMWCYVGESDNPGLPEGVFWDYCDPVAPEDMLQVTMETRQPDYWYNHQKGFDESFGGHFRFCEEEGGYFRYNICQLRGEVVNGIFGSQLGVGVAAVVVVVLAMVVFVAKFLKPSATHTPLMEADPEVTVA